MNHAFMSEHSACLPMWRSISCCFFHYLICNSEHKWASNDLPQIQMLAKASQVNPGYIFFLCALKSIYVSYCINSTFYLHHLQRKYAHILLWIFTKGRNSGSTQNITNLQGSRTASEEPEKLLNHLCIIY
jgi:hypothetical protein